MNDDLITLMVVQSGGSVKVSSIGGTREELFIFPSREALNNFLEKYKQEIVT